MSCWSDAGGTVMNATAGHPKDECFAFPTGKGCGQESLQSLRTLFDVKPVFDSFENAVTDNQRLTSAQGSVGTTSGSGRSQRL